MPAEGGEGRVWERSLLALDPVFVSRVAEGLEFDADRIELVEQRRSTDPTLRYIAMALQAGVETGDALNWMYGEGLSTALAAHLVREYGATVVKPKRQYGGLKREKLERAVEYIQDQLGSGLTVSGIAQAVGMSPYYFTRLFKESTGQSPYQYVVDARVKKIKGTSDNRQLHHQRSCTPGRFLRSEPSYPSFQKSFRLTS